MDLFLGASLISSFIAGMIALFAPCCISYMLPAYLGSVFKERKQVFFMTLVFSAGIFVVMFPIVLGFRVLSDLFMQYHNQTFIIGGFFMMLAGVFALLGVKLPMPRLNQPQTDTGKPDVLSVFTLGVFSGITSSCCAPVLFGVLTLSFMSPSLWMGALVAFVYVLGIVTPLYVLAYFVDAKKFLSAEFFKRKLTDLTISGKTYPILMSNLLAFLIFSPMGIVIIYLTMTGRLEMAEEAQMFGDWVGKLTIWISDTLGDGILIQFTFIGLIIGGLYLMFSNWRKRN